MRCPPHFLAWAPDSPLICSIRCWREVGAPDTNCPQSVANARAVGMTTAVYFFPDFTQDPNDQVFISCDKKLWTETDIFFC